MDYELRTTIVIDNDELIDYIDMNYCPEDVFSEEKLRTWAKENGYILPE